MKSVVNLSICNEFSNFINSLFITMACWVIDEDSASSSVIPEYAAKTSRVGTSLLWPIKLLITLNHFWKAKLDLMPGVLVVIME